LFATLEIQIKKNFNDIKLPFLSEVVLKTAGVVSPFSLNINYTDVTLNPFSSHQYAFNLFFIQKRKK